ncbi:type II toxin-antitoxin system HicB family antitoxin [Sporosarcina sp. FSL K6-1540]|uniref:type II toxin-antitoxin system HicB family antitoxin n=1 Tax=Sporosarcina sp. FSL K6-1540 TaxID=2921555 RepID=UPI003159F0DD
MPKYMYVAKFEWEDESNAYNVTFPDLLGCVTFGTDIADAIHMAKDVLEGFLLVAEDDAEVIPDASDFQQLNHSISGKDFIQYVEVDTDSARRREDNKSVNKMVTLPNYLVQLGKENNVNFSAMLQKALREELNLE